MKRNLQLGSRRLGNAPSRRAAWRTMSCHCVHQNACLFCCFGRKSPVPVDSGSENAQGVGLPLLVSSWRDRSLRRNCIKLPFPAFFAFSSSDDSAGAFKIFLSTRSCCRPEESNRPASSCPCPFRLRRMCAMDLLSVRLHCSVFIETEHSQLLGYAALPRRSQLKLALQVDLPCAEIQLPSVLPVV